MKLQVNIEVVPTDQKLLATILGCSQSALGSQLELHAQAAVTEYIESYLGRRAFTRGSDILEHRLALLIQTAFANRIPEDTTVARLFQLTQSGSRTLIRNTLSKYRYQLDGAASESAKSLLEAARWRGAPEDAYSADTSSSYLIEALNQRLAAEDASLKPILRNADTVGVISIDKFSYDKLCDAYKAKKVPRA